MVSTHSRAKAAAATGGHVIGPGTGFNTQPREGGCFERMDKLYISHCFNTQPREGGCLIFSNIHDTIFIVSTHSRAKAAAGGLTKKSSKIPVSTHSRAKAAAKSQKLDYVNITVSTHSRAKAAAIAINSSTAKKYVSTHSRAKAAACDE